MRLVIGFVFVLGGCCPFFGDDCLDPLPDDPGADDASTTVQDIQQGRIPDGTEGVQLRQVVVSAPFTLEGKGFFVQAQGGGPESGLYIYTGRPFEETELRIGDLVNVYGSVSEYFDFTELSVQTERAVQVVGSAEPTVDLLETTPDDWEPWESCLVRLPDQTALTGANNWGEVDLSAGIVMDNSYLDFVVQAGDELGDVAGVIVYSFEKFKINPRVATDIENGPGEVLVSTVADVQDGTVPTGSAVTLEGVVACSDLSSSVQGVFVQDVGGGPYSGVYAYVGYSVSITASIGDLLDVSGLVVEYYDMTEIQSSNSKITAAGGTGECVATPLEATVTDLEPYEGVFVELTDVEITSDRNSYGEFQTNYGINIDDWFYRVDTARGETYATVRGLLVYSYGDFKLCPRSPDDFIE
jgi:predicted extracellular nuclease